MNEVIVIDSPAYNNIVGMFEVIQKTVLEQANELRNLKEDRLMSIEEVANFLGFQPAWVRKYKDKIGHAHFTGGDIRFRKSRVDAYVNKHEILIKTK